MATPLTSWAIWTTTRSSLLMRGVTSRITPVLRYSTVLTMAGFEVVVAVEVWVTIGTWSPICRRALWLSKVIILGAETTSMAVREPRALSAASISPPR